MHDTLKKGFQLGDWLVRPLEGALIGPEGQRRLQPKAMDVLLWLAASAGEVVERKVLVKAVWGDRAVTDEPLTRCIGELRQALGESRGDPRYIQTIHKRGYKLLVPVTIVGTDSEIQLAKHTTSDENQLTGALAKPVASRFSMRWLSVPILLAAILAFAVVGIWRLSDDSSRARSVAIAVLPFDNLSDTGKDYFADGVHEELIGQLSRSNTLAVRSRTSTLQYRGSAQALPAIARELGVDVIVEGSVRQDGDTVRVTAQLIEASVDEHLWSGNIQKSLSVASLFAIQEEIAREIAAALRVTLAPDTQPSSDALPTESIDAYDSFMLGKYHYRRQLPDDIRKAVSSFEAAVRLDPGFADAWDWLAYAYNHAATNVGYLTPTEAYPKARSAALRALELEPDLATAVSILGYIRAVFDRDWVGAEADLQRAIHLDPDDSGTVWSLAHVYSLLGRHDDAVTLTRDFANKFPLRGRNHREVANRLIDAGRFEEALEVLAAALKRDDEPAQVADALSVALVGLEQYEEALAQLEYAVEAKQRDAGAVGRLAHVYGLLGRTDEAEALLAELDRRSVSEWISPFTLATAHAGLNNDDVAVRYLGQAAELRGREVLSIPNDPFFAGLRNHVEFQRIVASLKIPAQ